MGRKFSVDLQSLTWALPSAGRPSSGHIVVGWDSALVGVTQCRVTLITLRGVRCCTGGNSSFPKACEPRL